MMHTIVKVLTGTGLLIMLYLFLSHGNQTAKIIDSLASNSIKGIATLQGRG